MSVLLLWPNRAIVSRMPQIDIQPAKLSLIGINTHSYKHIMHPCTDACTRTNTEHLIQLIRTVG